jgi:uncharacterized LabA/DUF88 family protein
MPDQSYLFVDGAYLRQRHLEVISAVFGKFAEFDLSNLRQNLLHLTPLGAQEAFQRVFYYDCLHDIPKVGESDEQLKSRIQEQRAAFDRIQSLHGFHVRLGSLSGSSRKMRQKEVDILLTVEMLDHAFRRNMTSAALIAGDLDFAPLLDSLVRLGTWVDVLYDPKSIAKGLLASADRGIPFVFGNYYSMCTPEFRSANPLPQRQMVASWQPVDHGFTLTREGHLSNGDAVGLYEPLAGAVGAVGCLIFVKQDPPWMLLHNDRTVLENYFTAINSIVVWD